MAANDVEEQGGIVPVAQVYQERRASLDELFAAKKQPNPMSQLHPNKCNFKSRKAKAGLCVLVVLVVIAIVVGVLYPKIPTIVVDRDATLSTINVQKYNGVPQRVYGNISFSLDNANVMDIELKEMFLSVQLGKLAPTKTTVTTDIPPMHIPASSVSYHSIPVSIPLPSTLNLAGLAADLAADCVRDNRMTLVISGTAKLTALATNLDFKFGPMSVEAACLEDEP